MSKVRGRVIVVVGVLFAVYLASVAGSGRFIVNRTILPPTESQSRSIAVSLSSTTSGGEEIAVVIAATPLFTELSTVKLIVAKKAVEGGQILEATSARSEDQWDRSVVECSNSITFPVTRSELSRSFVAVRFVPVSRLLPAVATEVIIPMARLEQNRDNAGRSTGLDR